MLLELQVKNLALIEKAHIEFGEGLNILTGETGAGKSIIIGSVTIALGGKIPRDMIRKGADSAYIELIFSVRDPEKLRALKELDVFPADDGTLIISKKIMPSRSVSKVNDETVTAGKLREITSLLIDIHGQHEHQSLLYKAKHLEILDNYIRPKTQPLKLNIAETYRNYQLLKKQLEACSMDNESRKREADFCRFEIEEIEGAALKEGEEEELAREFRRFTNAQKITAALSLAYDAISGESMGRAVKAVQEACGFDESLNGIRDQLFDADAILSDAAREISSYMDARTCDEEWFGEMEARLDTVRTICAKYGGDVTKVNWHLEETKKKLEELENLDIIRRETEEKLKITGDKLELICAELSQIRKEASDGLVKKIRESLVDLNFIDVEFKMEFSRLNHYSSGGYDEVEFLISTNPGEAVKPLLMVASGGELSRIMLAVKAVLADTDEIGTLIFDEIDTGISGRTAQKVSEKLAYIAGNHQVICITHLPQIAAMADRHFEIAKGVWEGRTSTTIRPLSKEQMVEELARLLGGAKITDTVRMSAVEMKELADRTK